MIYPKKLDFYYTSEETESQPSMYKSYKIDRVIFAKKISKKMKKVLKGFCDKNSIIVISKNLKLVNKKSNPNDYKIENVEKFMIAEKLS